MINKQGIRSYKALGKSKFMININISALEWWITIFVYIDD